MSKRLQKYLDAQAEGGFAWKNLYHGEMVSEDDPWLCGHYMGMLDDLIEIIGIDRVRRLVAAMNDIEDGAVR